MQLKEQRIKRRFVQFLLEDHDLYQDPWPWGIYLYKISLKKKNIPINFFLNQVMSRFIEMVNFAAIRQVQPMAIV